MQYWPSSPITTIATDRIAVSGWRVPCPAASTLMAGWCRGPFSAACITSTREPLERGWSYVVLRRMAFRLGGTAMRGVKS